MTAMVRQVLQTRFEVEVADHLGYEPHDPTGPWRHVGDVSAKVALVR